MRILVLLTAFAGAASAGPVIWGTSNGGVSSPGELLRLDLVAGTATVVGGSGSSTQQWSDVAVQPGTGWIYTVGGQYLVSDPFSLFRVDPSTGATLVIVGSLGRRSISDIDFAPNGTLYGNWWNNGGNLIVVDPSNATVTVAPNPFGSGLQNGGVAVDPNTGVLWGIESSYSGTPSLFRIDPVTGVASGILRLGLNGSPTDFGFDSLAILPDGTMLGTRARGSNDIYQISPFADAGSGLAEVVIVPFVFDGPVAGSVNGLAVGVPEPRTLALLGVGVAAAWFLRRRLTAAEG